MIPVQAWKPTLFPFDMYSRSSDSNFPVEETMAFRSMSILSDFPGSKLMKSVCSNLCNGAVRNTAGAGAGPGVV